MKVKIIVIITMLILVHYSMATGASLSANYYPSANQSGGFFKGSEITYVYTGNYSCYPPLNTVVSNLTKNQSQLDCYSGIKSSVSQALPDWVLVPAYAGMSVFGTNSSNGMPVFENSTVYTDCGVGNQSVDCASDPSYVYSPIYANLESLIGVKGLGGKPHGVLPYPAHSHLVNDTFAGDPIPWYVIVVYVLDPNIMPNATNGQCKTIIASNVSNPTSNCLTSLSAIKRAMVTYDNATSNANSGNPLWDALGDPNTEVYIPNDTNVSDVGNPNTNIVIPFAAKSLDFYTSKPLNTTATTTIEAKPPKTIKTSRYYYVAILIFAIVVILVATLFALRLKTSKMHKT